MPIFKRNRAETKAARKRSVGTTTGGEIFEDLGFGQLVNGNQGHSQQTLLSVITKGTSYDIADAGKFPMKARALGTKKDVSENNPYVHAFNIAANQQLHAFAFRSWISTSLDWTGECFIQELPSPGGGITLGPLYDRRIDIMKAKSGFMPDGSRAIIAGYIERNLQGIETGRYDANGLAISGTAAGRIHRIWYGSPLDPFKPDPFVDAAAIPISTVHYSNLAVRALMANSGVPGGLVQIKDEDIPDDELELFERRINSRFADPTQKGKYVVVGNDTELKPLSTQAPGAGWAGLSDSARTDAMSVWYMPQSRLGVGGSRTYENQRVELAAYFKNMVMTRLSLIASSLSQFTRTLGFELYFEPTDVPELAEDTAYKITQSETLYQAGIATLDESRTVVGLPPVGGEVGNAFVAPGVKPIPPVPGTAIGHSASPAELRAGDAVPLAIAAKSR